MYDIGQHPFYLYSVHRTSVSGERSRASGPLVLSGYEHRIFGISAPNLSGVFQIIVRLVDFNNPLLIDTHFDVSTTDSF